MTSTFIKHRGSKVVLGAFTTVLMNSHGIAGDTFGTSTPKEVNGAALEEIIVTAERREEKLDKVPISVTAFSQKTMDELHIQSFNDLASIVPGLVVSTPQSGVQGLRCRHPRYFQWR